MCDDRKTKTEFKTERTRWPPWSGQRPCDALGRRIARNVERRVRRGSTAQDHARYKMSGDNHMWHRTANTLQSIRRSGSTRTEKKTPRRENKTRTKDRPGGNSETKEDRPAEGMQI